MTESKPEVWLRGPLPDVPALLQPVAHALFTQRVIGLPLRSEKLEWRVRKGWKCVDRPGREKFGWKGQITSTFRALVDLGA